MSEEKISLAQFFTEDHRACDAKWAEVEAAVDGGDPGTTKGAWQAFREATDRHLEMEESVLFPAWEKATGMHGSGPTAVMRSEHQQIRGLMNQIASLVETGDLDGVLNQGDTLLMLIQQHNMKEESMLYPMAEQRLVEEWDAMHEKLGR